MTLHDLRLRSTYAISIVGVIMGVCGIGLEIWLQSGFGPGSIVSVMCLLALVVAAVFARGTQTFRYIAVSVMMGEVMGLLIAARGYPWQMDLHMTFFAALALCGLMYDVRAIILGTLLVVVHHIGLGLFMDTLVFYGSGGVLRAVLHAVLLALEAGGLIILTHNTRHLLAFADGKSAEAAAEAEKVRSIAASTHEERAARDSEYSRMVMRLEELFGEVVSRAADGQFDGRVPENFGDASLDGLARKVNGLVEAMDRGLRETATVLSELADANLAARMSGEHSGAFARVKVDINRLAETFTSIVTHLRDTSRSLKSATGEMLVGSADLANRTSEQASTLQGTSTAIHQLATTVTENARRAREASNVAGAVSGTAEAGGAVMRQATEAMERITASSGKISNIIGLIDDIAFQTNLLALNASVEAARAGEAGRGFAVVAVEVRRLAQSAASASADVKALVEQSGQEVRNGSMLVAGAAGKLEAMLDAARSNNEMMTLIASRSDEQAVAIDQINTAVHRLDQMTQHNAALVHQTSAAIEQTEVQARELDGIVKTFTLDAAMPAARPAAAPKSFRPRIYAGGQPANAADWEEF